MFKHRHSVTKRLRGITNTEKVIYIYQEIQKEIKKHLEIEKETSYYNNNNNNDNDNNNNNNNIHNKNDEPFS